MDLGSKAFPQPILKISQMGIPSEWNPDRGFSTRGTFSGMQTRHEFFRLANVESFLNHPFRRKLLLLFRDQTEDYLGVSDGKAAITIENDGRQSSPSGSFDVCLPAKVRW